MKSLVIIPVYNERDNIKKIIEKIFSLNLNLDVLAIDDNSPDGTGDILKQLQESYRQIEVIYRPKKLGLGTAYIQGFKHALDRGYDCIFTMDADFSHSPDYLPVFLNELKEYDFVIGSRYVPEGGVVGWPWKRKLLSRFGNLYAKIVTGLKINDCTSGFTGMRKEVIESLPLDEIKSEGYGFTIELKYRVQKKGYKIKEIPIVFVDRIVGKSKISRKIVFEAILLVWKLRLRIK